MPLSLTQSVSLSLLLLVGLTASAEEFPLELATPTGTVHGTLTQPGGAAPAPVVLFIAGSGPTDRNGNGLGGLHTDCYRQLAGELARAGIASVRYDKRGIGASRAAITREADLRFEHYADDAAAWCELLRRDARFSAVFILGHSEGAHLGLLAAAQTTLDGYISIAGPGEPPAAILRAQLQPKLPADLWAVAENILAKLARGEPAEEEIPLALAMLFRPSVQPYLISWFRHDPAAQIARLRMPILLVQGGTDLQVDRANAERLHAARPDHSTLVIIEDMNHVLKTDRGDLAAQWQTSYTNPAPPLAPELAPAVIRFVRENSPAPAS